MRHPGVLRIVLHHKGFKLPNGRGPAYLVEQLFNAELTE